jgi:hypothetical protein
LVISNDGRVTDIAQRAVSPVVQQQFLRRVSHPEDPMRTVVTYNADEITPREFSAYGPDWPGQILDVRDRRSFALSHREGARNIPFDELPVRAPAELDLSRPVLVDCDERRPDLCRIAGAQLIEEGFSEVRILLKY